MTTLYNPALYEESRNRPVTIIPPIPRKTLLGWLEDTGRFRASTGDDVLDPRMSEELDEILEPEVYDSQAEEDQSDQE